MRPHSCLDWPNPLKNTARSCTAANTRKLLSHTRMTPLVPTSYAPDAYHEQEPHLFVRVSFHPYTYLMHISPYVRISTETQFTSIHHPYHSYVYQKFHTCITFQSHSHTCMIRVRPEWSYGYGAGLRITRVCPLGSPSIDVWTCPIRVWPSAIPDLNL